MKLSPRITTVASSAVANLCLIPETGGERGGGRRRVEGGRGLIEAERSKVKALGKRRTHAAESNRCATTKAAERIQREERAAAAACTCVSRADECSRASLQSEDP